MAATHYLHEGNILCSTSAENIEYSSSIINVSCGHCWKKYDNLEDRIVNVPEMRSCAAQLRHHLKTAAKIYMSEDDFFAEEELIAEYGFWFLEGPDSVPDELRRDDRDMPALEAGHGIIRSRFMKASDDSLHQFGISSKKYRESVDQLIRALRPVLFETDKKIQKSEIDLSLKRSMLQREGEKCDICDAPLNGPDSESPAVDHIIPEALGGPTEKWNLRVLCQSCNEFKHVMIDPDGVEKVADRLENKIAD